MAKIEVKRMKALMTENEMQPHYIATVDYGFVEVEIPLPARNLDGDDTEQFYRESLEAMERLARALLDFVDQTRNRLPPEWR
jgi:hypothetical protein